MKTNALIVSKYYELLMNCLGKKWVDHSLLTDRPSWARPRSDFARVLTFIPHLMRMSTSPSRESLEQAYLPDSDQECANLANLCQKKPRVKDPRTFPQCGVNPNLTCPCEDDYFPSTQAPDVGDPLHQRISITTPKPSLGQVRPRPPRDAQYFRTYDFEPRSSGFGQGIDVSIRASFHDRFDSVD